MALAYLDAEAVNKYLPRDEGIQFGEEVTDIEDELERDVVSWAFSRLARIQDTSGWVSAETTPGLVLTILALKFAGRIYNREAADSFTDETVYGNGLQDEAAVLLEGIIAGDLLLTDAGPGLVVTAVDVPLYEETEPMFTTDMSF